MTKLEEEVLKLQEIIKKKDIELSMLRSAKNDLVHAIDKIAELEEIIHDLRNDLFAYKELNIQKPTGE
jgi:hypothetical protein